MENPVAGVGHPAVPNNVDLEMGKQEMTLDGCYCVRDLAWRGPPFFGV